MTSTQKDAVAVANQLLNPKNLEAISSDILQQLWSGYGTISRLKVVSISKSRTEESPTRSLILKHVTPPSADLQESEGHIRKLISYQVEQFFYKDLAPLMPEDIAVAKLLAQSSDVNSMAMIMTDLREQYPVASTKRGDLDKKQVYAALSWLAKFHGFWWQRTKELKSKGLRLPPLEASSCQKGGVWLNGGYTYLATRRTEYASLQHDEDSAWAQKLCVPAQRSKSSIAELVANALSPSISSSSSIAGYETLIHGDVKSENLFAASTGSAVAFFDFQYVGLGLGVCDLAKLFTCSVPSELLEDHDGGNSKDMAAGERTLLEYYQRTIEEASGRSYPWELLKMHWKTALVDWLRFQASWGFWGNTDWLESRVRHILEDKAWNEWVLENGNTSRS